MIELSHIVKDFGQHRVLNGINVAIREGSVTALVGPSGGGKSTLLRCINLLEIPTSGRVRIGAEAIDFSPNVRVPFAEVQKLRRQTGMVFQNFQLFPHRTALGNVIEPLVTVLRWSHDKAVAKAEELLAKVGMAHKRDAWPAELSGGQQQRVAIARALAPSPRVLLCDEPTSALDPELAGEVIEVLVGLAREGTTMVIATHDLRLAAGIAHEVVFLEAGEVVEKGTAARVFSSPERARTRQFITSLSDGLRSAPAGH